MADLEKRKKKRLEEEKAKAAAMSGPSGGDLAAKTSRATSSNVPHSPSSASKRPHILSQPIRKMILLRRGRRRLKQLQGATEKARAEGKKEGEKETRDEIEREKKKAFDEGYSQGYDQATDELVDQVENAEVLFKQQQHAQSYALGYCKALDKAGVAADDARRTTIEVPLLAESEHHDCVYSVVLIEFRMVSYGYLPIGAPCLGEAYRREAKDPPRQSRRGKYATRVEGRGLRTIIRTSGMLKATKYLPIRLEERGLRSMRPYE
ncbi:hypothetical protein RHMOL_Rhmol04G0253400 [Rhododendron molle]|uniref:Uncharacterized protein n=1 Tax=Rhododendron molle TaxID=49168 RepID=A0ACC0P6S4_RHOML|nr:hypothetical protein RHMOL_Rhmol04G0253400 [Rhododendron molle]